VEAALKEQARALGIGERVQFLGQRSDVPALMAAADVFCQPNTGAEPFGLVFVEALRAGLPVVSTAMGGALEIVSAECGLLVPPEAEAVAGALAALIDDADRRRRLGAAGPARASALSDPAGRLEELESALRGIAGRPR
jgi:glycosyltransferase involved in cell wall biosynthesis